MDFARYSGYLGQAAAVVDSLNGVVVQIMENVQKDVEDTLSDVADKLEEWELALNHDAQDAPVDETPHKPSTPEEKLDYIIDDGINRGYGFAWRPLKNPENRSHQEWLTKSMADILERRFDEAWSRNNVQTGPVGSDDPKENLLNTLRDKGYDYLADMLSKQNVRPETLDYARKFCSDKDWDRFINRSQFKW